MMSALSFYMSADELSTAAELWHEDGDGGRGGGGEGGGDLAAMDSSCGRTRASGGSPSIEDISTMLRGSGFASPQPSRSNVDSVATAGTGGVDAAAAAAAAVAPGVDAGGAGFGGSFGSPFEILRLPSAFPALRAEARGAVSLVRRVLRRLRENVSARAVARPALRAWSAAAACRGRLRRLQAEATQKLLWLRAAGGLERWRQRTAGSAARRSALERHWSEHR